MPRILVKAPELKTKSDILPAGARRRPPDNLDAGGARYPCPGFILAGIATTAEGSKSSSASQQLDHQEDNGNNQNEMDQTARHVKAEPEEPKDDEDNDEGIEHMAWGLFSLRDWRWLRG
jgi:hypothetical protein